MNKKSDLLDEPANFSLALGGPLFQFFLRNGDIQSLADLGNSFTVVNETRLVPFDKALVFYLAIYIGRVAAATPALRVPLGGNDRSDRCSVTVR